MKVIEAAMKVVFALSPMLMEIAAKTHREFILTILCVVLICLFASFYAICAAEIHKRNVKDALEEKGDY